MYLDMAHELSQLLCQVNALMGLTSLQLVKALIQLIFLLKFSPAKEQVMGQMNSSYPNHPNSM